LFALIRKTSVTKPQTTGLGHPRLPARVVVEPDHEKAIKELAFDDPDLKPFVG
jgi:hypothetical protein